LPQPQLSRFPGLDIRFCRAAEPVATLRGRSGREAAQGMNVGGELGALGLGTGGDFPSMHCWLAHCVPGCQEHRKAEKGHPRVGAPTFFPVLLTALALVAAGLLKPSGWTVGAGCV
jgi:hypothetical protein